MDTFLRTLFLSIETGAVYASFALAIVIVYRTSRILNFAQGEMATMGVFLVWQLHAESGLPFIGTQTGLWVAIGISLVFSFVLGAGIERLLIRPVSSSANPLAPIIVTIALFLGINGLVGYLWTRQPQILPNPFPPDVGWDIGGARLTATTIGCLAVLAAEGILLVLLFQRTKIGLGLRAVADNEESARLVGVPVGRMLMVGWGLAAVAGTVAALLQVAILPAHSFDPNLMVPTLVFGFAAATLGGFDSPLGAVVGGMTVAFVEKFSLQYIDAIGSELSVASAFVVILLVLLVRPQGLFGRAEVTRRMSRDRTALLRLGGVVLLLVVAYSIPFNTEDTALRDFVTVITYALPALGLALLTGYSGQISVGHGAFMAIGAYTTAILVADRATPWFLAIALSVVVAGVAGALVGLPALRIRGPALALATLGLAVLVPQVIVRFKSVTGGSQGKRLFQYRFRSPFESLTDEQWIYLVAVTFLLLALLLVRNLVRSRVGRGLITIRDNELAAEVMGVNVAIYKILVFAASGMLAGLGGALAVVAQPSVAPGDYGIQLSIRLLVMAVVGGIATVAGPVIGAAAVYYLDDWIKTSDSLADLLQGDSPELAPVVFGAVLIALMMVMPDGLVGGGRRLWARLRSSGPAAVEPTEPGEPPPADLSSASSAAAEAPPTA